MKKKIHHYGYEDGKKGLEASYMCDGEGHLFIRITGSDHWYDYFQNFLAWPREKLWLGLRVHRAWYRMAQGLAAHIKKTVPIEERQSLYIAGHSMGGAVGAILTLLLSSKKCMVWVVNAPKAGNKQFMQWLERCSDFWLHYDAGDVVRHLPFLYAKYPREKQYAKTSPFWRAHNNLPDWWHSFPDRVKVPEVK